MEKARRWSGFVCPDCRFVFRVSSEHDGRGVICPSCRRLLKIPLPEDVTPPLVVPLPADDSNKEKKKRRKGRSRRHSGHDWESTDDEDRISSRRAKRQMRWMLAGGSALFAFIVAVVLKTMSGGENGTQALPPPVIQQPTPMPDAAAADMSDADFLSAAEPLAKKFLSATRVDDLLPLVRNPQSAGPRLRARYADGKLEAPGMGSFDTLREVVRNGSAISVQVRTAGLDEKPLVFFMTPDGLKIDWESWVGWSEMPWDDFLTTKPATGKLFRVWLSAVDYYNFAFSDDLKWQSYRFESPDGEHAIYGYVERGSVLDNRLRPSPDKKKTALTVMLSFPENATSRNQVLVGKLIAEDWTLETEESP